MTTLAFDTSTSILSIAIEGDGFYEERLVSGCFSHSEDLLAEIEAVIKRSGTEIKDLDLIVVAKGPGSFTGLRIGMASAKGLSLALSIPIVSVPTLDAISMAAEPYGGAIISAIDAKRKRFYFSMKRGQETIIPDMDGDSKEAEEAIRKEDLPVLITGPDAALFASKLDPELDIIVDRGPRCIGRALIDLGKARLREIGPDEIGTGPVYIRRSDAEEALEKRIKEKEKENGV